MSKHRFPVNSSRLRILFVPLTFSGLLALLLLLLVGQPYPKAQLPGGPILKVEGASFGTHHRVGGRLHLRSPWLTPPSEMHLPRPALMVWLTAMDPLSGKPASLPQLQVWMTDSKGNSYSGRSVWGMTDSSGFQRSGYSFESFPRSERRLRLQLASVEDNTSVQIQIQNPSVRKPVQMVGKPLPQSTKVGPLEVVLSSLELQTNRYAFSKVAPPMRYWEPKWELRRAGKPEAGWEQPEWEAEDQLGNQGQFLGIHQPVLKFKAKLYPSPTNTAAAVLLGKSPAAALGSLQSNVWWNTEVGYGSLKVKLLGIFPPGSYTFSEGRLLRAIYGTGLDQQSRDDVWSGSGRSRSMFRRRQIDYRHSPSLPTIYLTGLDSSEVERLSLRLRDDHERLWNTKLVHSRDGKVCACLVSLPPDVKSIVAEVVLLQPLQAEFVVATRAAQPKAD
jgi:hypothetical protein